MVAKLLLLSKRADRDHTAGMEDPRHVLEASRHPDPYGWYARLRVSRPVFFDAGLGLWVVSGPYLVEQGLRHPLLRVRPPAEPVPPALRGRAAGEVFAQLVRMNDGEFHARHRPAVAQSTSRFGEADVAHAAQATVRDLAPRRAANALLSEIPVQCMARLLAVADAELDVTVQWVHAFAQGIAGGASGEALAGADTAARALMAQGERDGLSRVRAANRIALMQQALDATAGLLGNAIHAALRHPWEDAGALVARVAHADPPIHNTRRFAAAALELGGQAIEAGQGVVLVLVPDLPFGRGPHTCPGERIALQIAATALRTLASIAPLERTFGEVRGYRPLPNARIPLFTA
jgi:cytochrome P450